MGYIPDGETRLLVENTDCLDEPRRRCDVPYISVVTDQVAKLSRLLLLRDLPSPVDIVVAHG